MVRRGAVVSAVDNSANQLATCRRLQGEHGLDFETLHGNAETLPFADECFDFAISEYGAAIWADPYRWIPEAHRLLQPGGRLRLWAIAPLQMLCVPADGSETTSRLERPYFGMHRFDWRTVEADPGGVEFNLTISAWIQLFSQTGFIVENYLEQIAPSDAQGSPFGVSAEWARSYPSEQVWMLRKQA